MKKIPWRKILKSMGYQRKSGLWGAPCWINSTGVSLIESLIPRSGVIEYVKVMEEYEMIFYDYYMEMESLWIEGDIV